LTSSWCWRTRVTRVNRKLKVKGAKPIKVGEGSGRTLDTHRKIRRQRDEKEELRVERVHAQRGGRGDEICTCIRTLSLGRL
jgi:hypothetical protein